MKSHWSLHALGVAVLSVLVCLLFLREPGFGDDFTYWSFAFDLHERGLAAWGKQSFHDLRWPVWGVSWLLQAILGPGLLSFYGVPLIYLIAGALLAFTFGRIITNSVGVAWTAAIAFLFHPLLDTVCYRPMPDLSEGVWGAAAVLVWWKMTQARGQGASLSWAALLGLIVYIIESNRLTGVFIVPVLVLCTLLYARQTFGWLVVAGGIAAVLYVAEAAFYHQLFGDWLHNLHANMGAKGRKGTESVVLWSLPFRFLDTLWKGNALAPLYGVLAIIGGWAVWQPGKRLGNVASGLGDPDATAPPGLPVPLGRVVVLWLVALYLEYACAPQSLWPYRPLIRDADRFLCGIVVPFSILAALGGLCVVRQPFLRQQRWIRFLDEHPAICTVVALVLLTTITARELISVGSMPEMRRYMRSRPEGTKVFTHDDMRAYAFLIDPQAARRFTWLFTRNQILYREPKLEAMAAQAQEFWYIRKLVWLTTRKQLERKNVEEQRPLASYFAEPEREWTMARLLAKGDTPDLIFYRRRTPDTPPPRILDAHAPEFASLIPTLPIEWKGSRKDTVIDRTWQVPESLRGLLCRIEIEAASDKVEAFTARLSFMKGKRTEAEYLLKPYLHPHGGKEFFLFQIPATADHCLVQLKLTKNTEAVRFTGFRAVVEPPKE